MKTKIAIKNRFTGEIIFESKCNSILECLLQAIKSSANLRFADLRSANLSSANLRSADLSSANLGYVNLSSADLSSADLSCANLSCANLSCADLRSANLSSADLSSADLSSANLSSANLSSANLGYVKTDKRYIQISCIGSAKRMTTYCFEDDRIWCGCFMGTLAEFEKSVNKTHKDNTQWLKEYTGAINYIKSLK